MRAVSIVGCGYTGRRLSTRWHTAGAAVRGFARRGESLAQLAEVGATAAALDLDEPPQSGAPLLELDAQLVYYCVPPDAAGERDLRLERFLTRSAGRPQRLVYFSTTGVYGDRAGGRVDEDTPPAPATPRAIRRLAAETVLREWADAHSVSWCILRVPGIYGPGRLPLDRLRAAQPTIRAAEAMPTNRIHVDDLASAAVAAAIAPDAHRRIYNVTDGSEDSSTRFQQRVARIAGLAPPPEISRREAQTRLTPAALSFLNESRRVDNRRMLAELRIELRYRDLDAGIRASL